MALTTVLKDVAKVAGTGVPGAIYNGVTNGNWTDITPGYSAGAVLNTQFGSKPTANGQPIGSNPTPNPTPNPAPANPYSGDSGTSAQDAQDRAMALFGIDNGLSSANNALGRLDSQANTGYGNIDREYQDAYNRLDSTHQLGNQQYTQNKNSQLNDYLAKKAQVESQASSWLDAARRTLGTQGAGGGSAARYGVPFEAQNQATEGTAAAQATNNHNIQAIEQGHQQDEDKFKNSLSDIIRQRDQGKNDYQSQIENQRATLLSTIAQLTGQKQIANGGDFRAAQAAANPYTSQIQAIMSKIDGLAATPAVNAQNYTLSAPDLTGYNWAQPANPVNPIQDPTLAQPGYVPTYGTDQQDQNNPIYSLFGLDPNQRQFA
jgi:hypothetical protein